MCKVRGLRELQALGTKEGLRPKTGDGRRDVRGAVGGQSEAGSQGRLQRTGGGLASRRFGSLVSCCESQARVPPFSSNQSGHPRPQDAHG
jgi:hypothetical protein